MSSLYILTYDSFRYSLPERSLDTCLVSFPWSLKNPFFKKQICGRELSERKNQFNLGKYFHFIWFEKYFCGVLIPGWQMEIFYYLTVSPAFDETLAIVPSPALHLMCFFPLVALLSFLSLWFSISLGYAYVRFSLYLHCLKFSAFLICGSKFFMNFGKVLVITPFFFLPYALFSPPRFQIHGFTETSYSVLFLSVFQVSKFLLSLAWFNGISFHVLDYW